LSEPVQLIALQKNCLQNDQLCVWWHVKAYSTDNSCAWPQPGLPVN